MSTDSVRVASPGDIADETALRVEVNGVPVCLARSNGELFAVSDICSHAEVSLSEGEVEDGHIECWLHGSMFDLRSGKPTGLPANKPIAVYTVSTEGDDVFVSLTPPGA